VPNPLAKQAFGHPEPKSSNRVGEARFQDNKQLFRVGETRFLFYENANRRGERRFISKAWERGASQWAFGANKCKPCRRAAVPGSQSIVS